MGVAESSIIGGDHSNVNAHVTQELARNLPSCPGAVPWNSDSQAVPPNILRQTYARLAVWLVF